MRLNIRKSKMHSNQRRYRLEFCESIINRCHDLESSKDSRMGMGMRRLELHILVSCC